jgi:CHAD domain-containing protein
MANPPIRAEAGVSPAILAPGASRDITTGAALRWIVALQLTSIRAHRDHLAAAADVQLVHDSRRDLARLRAALNTFSDAFRPTDWSWIDDELSALSRSLGEARDLDILLRRMTRARAEQHRSSGDDALRLAVATAAREIAVPRARAFASGARASFLLVGLESWVMDPKSLDDWRNASTPFAIEAPRLLRVLRDALPPGDSRIDKLDVEDRHDLRKALKVLRYSGELARAALGEKDSGGDPRLLAVLDILGALNDAEVCHRLWKRLFTDLKLEGAGEPRPGKRHLKALNRAWRDFCLPVVRV